MSSRYYITDARLLLTDEEITDGSLLIEDGHIAAICPMQAPLDAEEINLHGQVLAPGLVDLHADAIESTIEPRPGTFIPDEFACYLLDRQLAAVGITTFYHALSFSGAELGLRNNARVAELSRNIATFAEHGLVDHHVHARYEITEADALDMIKSLIDEEVVTMVSVMDHTPGQGQYHTMEEYHNYLVKKYKYDDSYAQELIDQKILGAEGAYQRMTALIEHAKAANIKIASHDDDTPEKVMLNHDLGIDICEFPMTDATGDKLVEIGMSALAGSPNVFRGGSHNKHGISALNLIKKGYVNCLCSDYIPATMLPAAFIISRDLDWPLYKAFKILTEYPAQAAGLTDRGRIEVGRRADLIAIDSTGPFPAVSHTWVAGSLVFKAGYSELPKPESALV